MNLDLLPEGSFPRKLLIEGLENCIEYTDRGAGYYVDAFEPLDGGVREACLPDKRSKNCSRQVWDDLQTEHSYERIPLCTNPTSGVSTVALRSFKSIIQFTAFLRGIMILLFSRYKTLWLF